MNPKQTDEIVLPKKAAEPGPGVVYTERLKECLVAVGCPVPWAQSNLDALSSCMRDMSPSIRTMLGLRTAVAGERERRKDAERRLDELREVIERALCDAPTKNEILRSLESLLDASSYDGDGG